MTEREAAQSVATLAAAFPSPSVPTETLALYVAQVATLEDALVMRAAVRRIIQTEDRWPSIATIRKHYFEVRRAAGIEDRGLAEQALSETERLENLRRVNELTTSIGLRGAA